MKSLRLGEVRRGASEMLYDMIEKYRNEWLALHCSANGVEVDRLVAIRMLLSSCYSYNSTDILFCPTL